MADFKQNYFQRRTKDRGPKSNNRISSPEVQVIDSKGENLGILNTNEAIAMAKEEGLDLIDRPVFTVQFHPEACPGPHDAYTLFKRFREMVDSYYGGENYSSA